MIRFSKKKVHKASYLILLVFFTSCTTAEQDIITISIPSQKTQDDITSIVTNSTKSILYYPDTVKFGILTNVKKDGDYLILASEYNSQSLICYKNSDFQYSIDDFGSGPGEYGELYGFAINEEHNRLCLYDRNSLKLLFYELSSGKFLEEKKINRFVSNLEYLDNQLLILSKDVREGLSDNYLETVNLPFLEVIAGIKSDYIFLPEAVFPSHFTRIDNLYYYTEPFTEVVYAINAKGKIEKLAKIDYIGQGLPLKLITDDNVEMIENDIEKNQYSFNTHLFTIQDSTVTFFNHLGITDYQAHIFDLTNMQVRKSYHVNRSLVNNSLPYPQTSSEGRFLHFSALDEINYVDNLWVEDIIYDSVLNKKGFLMISYDLL